MGLLSVQASPPPSSPPLSSSFEEPPPPPPPPIRETAPPPAADFSERVEDDPAAAMVQLRNERIEIRERVQFETWKSEISRSSFRILDQIATLLKRNPQVRKIEIQGHTSVTRRNRERLQPLSQRRANAVRAYLIRAGVEKDRLVARGYGYQNPIASNNTPEGRETNRRVEFVILEQRAVDPAPPPSGADFAPPPAQPGGSDDGGFGDNDFGDDGFDDFDDFEDDEDFDDDDDFLE